MIVSSTCDLCDAHKNEGEGIRALPPMFHRYGKRARFFGPVTTVKCFEDNSMVRAVLEGSGTIDTPSGRQGRILVIDGGGSLRRALLGGNLAAAAVRNGWAGIVVNGCVRDAAELAQCDVGIRALALMPMPPEKRGEGQRDVPLQIQGIPVRPGDWLVADEDGIVLMAQAPQ